MADNPALEKRFADRPPRIQPELPEEKVQIPKPPEENQGGMSIVQSLFPLITIIGYVAVSFFGQGRNLLFIIPMGLSVGVSSVYMFWAFYQNQREFRARKREYDNMLAEMRRDMVASHDTQRSFYEYNYTDPVTTLNIDGINYDSRSGSRLWERRTGDHDFAMMRIGIGARPSTVLYDVDRGENEENPQMKDAIKLAEDSRIVFNVPITLPLYAAHYDEKEMEKTGEEIPIRHAMGISGEPKEVYPVVRSLLANYVAFHAPNDTNIFVTGVHQAEKNWDWLYPDRDKSYNHANKTPQEQKKPRQPLVPHFVLPKSDRDAEFFPICFEDAGGKHEDREQDRVAKFWKLLRNELERRDLRIQDDSKQRNAVSLPFLLVIVDLLDNYNPRHPDAFLENSLFRDVEAEAAVATLLQKGLSLGASVIFLVPARQKIPSGCNAVLEIARIVNDDQDRVDMRYAEVGLNTPRYVGTADTVTQIDRLERFARNLSQWAVRRSYGEGIPDAVGLLELHRASSVPAIDIPGRWHGTRYATKGREENGKEVEAPADWLRVAMGIMSNDEIRRLYFKADGDGVHGMVAGATGSGKSELLMTMILGLAVDYDPSIVNFALIDYKGGAAFEPFKNLPHCVDIVTNLGGAAVNRMFRAVQAELNRRQAINTYTESKHIVDYRQRGLHLMDPEDFKARFGHEKTPYPHLFIIVDEFAEMMEGNAEFKEQLNSITRLGRALGVVLILAAQRPTGVTDQMRANIKMKLSLRVETREESSEMLRRPDAAYLPPGIPGRGYLQIGNENLELIQVAWSGAKYKEYRELLGMNAGQINWNEYVDRPVIWPDRLDKEPDEPPQLFEVLVDYMDRLSRSETPYMPQMKPWPNPLPRYMPLGESVPESGRYIEIEDRLYLETQRDKMRLPNQGDEFLDVLNVNAAVARWLAWEPGDDSGVKYPWLGVDWQEDAMRCIVGMVDDASNALQRLLWANLRRGHLAIFGASGWGKTTFLRTVATALVAAHSPEEMHIYVMDFGGRQLEILRDLPHVGSIIRPDETERIDRLVRWLDDELERRKQVLSEARTTNIYSYNSNVMSRRRAGHTDNQLIPAILVMVDNFAEIRENMEDLILPITSLVREGLSNGIHFVVTGETSSSLGKLYGLFSDRVTLKLADSSEYGVIVGRGAPGMEETQGRGYVVMNRTPLEFQTALPIGVTEKDRANDKDETTVLGEFVQKLNRAWVEGQRDPSVLPQPIRELPEVVTIESLLDILPEVPEVPSTFMGIDDRTLGVAIVEHPRGLPHFIVTGQQQTGKTTALRNMILTLALHYSPQQIGMVLIDRLGYLFNYGGEHSLSELPHVLMTIAEPEEMDELMKHLDYEFRDMEPENMPPRELFIFIDNYDDFQELNPKIERLAGLTRTSPERPVLHFIVCGSDNAMRSMNDFLRRISRHGLSMDNKSVQNQPFNVSLKRQLRDAELPIGRGFVVRSGKPFMLQVALPATSERAIIEVLDNYIAQVERRFTDVPRAAWVPLPVETGEAIDLEAVYEPHLDRILELMVEAGEVPSVASAKMSLELSMELDPESNALLDMIKAAESMGILEKLNIELGGVGVPVSPPASASSNGAEGEPADSNGHTEPAVLNADEPTDDLTDADDQPADTPTSETTE